MADKKSRTEADNVLTVQQVARDLRVSRNRVMEFILSGELQAEDWRSPGTSRHQWRIDPASVMDWRRRRRFHATLPGRAKASRPSTKTAISLF
jgi:Helix-turn-helix domain